MPEKEEPITKPDPDGPPSYDETDTPPPPEFKPDLKLETTESSTSEHSYSAVIPQPSIVALDANPPKFATITIHYWNRLRFVNFPQSALEAVDGAAKAFYLNGIKWVFDHGQWSLKTDARAFQTVDGGAGRYLLLAILTRLSQFGYEPHTILAANSPSLLDKDTYFFKRDNTPPLPPAPTSAIRDLSSTAPLPSASKAGFGGMFSILSLGKEEEKKLPDIGIIQSFDQTRYHGGKRYFCLSIRRSDRLTILGCPGDTVLEGITKAITVWPDGVESVISTEMYGVMVVPSCTTARP